MEPNFTEPPNNDTPKETKKSSSVLPKLEIMIIGVFFFSFLIWAASKCSRTKTKYQEMAIEAQKEDSLLKIINQELTKPIKEIEPEELVEQTAAVSERITPLYVTVENLNMRDKPSRKGKILARLKLFDEVTFMDEVTDFKEEISLEDLTTNEPWIKVQTEEGTIGWVYGAYVEYYKTKLQTELGGATSSSNN